MVWFVNTAIYKNNGKILNLSPIAFCQRSCSKRRDQDFPVFVISLMAW